jgi:hypothetical protein
LTNPCGRLQEATESGQTGRNRFSYELQMGKMSIGYKSFTPMIIQAEMKTPKSKGEQDEKSGGGRLRRLHG